MTLKEVIEQLKDLITDRESFIGADEDPRAIFVKDKKALEEAVELLELIQSSEESIELYYEGKGIYYEARDKYAVRIGTIMNGGNGKNESSF